MDLFPVSVDQVAPMAAGAGDSRVAWAAEAHVRVVGGSAAGGRGRAGEAAARLSVGDATGAADASQEDDGVDARREAEGGNANDSSCVSGGTRGGQCNGRPSRHLMQTRRWAVRWTHLFPPR